MERTRTNTVRFIAPRDQDELEGALLLPIASTVDNTYDQLIATEAEVVVDSSDPIDPVVPTAQTIPSYDTVESRERAMLRQAAEAERRGQILAEIEREKLRKAEIDVFAINYHADRKVEEANRLARERDRQGLEIQKDKWFGHETSEERSSANESGEYQPAFPLPRHGGYEVAEYNPSEYSVDTEYNVSEYKSVYD
ncbi:hypothetical protein MHU86_449 [Fragilaria crotonensis]|nr:hypothetical protein MHU86_449 [Fragilaria crotonensis]